MKRRSSSVLPIKLSQAQQQFEQWRSQQHGRRRLPDHLWTLAVKLAREFGLSRTAKTLRLDHTTLKHKSQADHCVPIAPISFVELQPDRPQVECTIDCQGASGQPIRIHLKGPDWPDLTGLCQGLWDR